jgi:hypothetical protein
MDQEQLDYADVHNVRAMSPLWVRRLWCAVLIVSPLMMAVLGIAFERPRDRIYFDRPWPTRAIDALVYIHAGLSFILAFSAGRIWGRHWWKAWVGIVIVGVLTCMVAFSAIVSTLGFGF